MAAELSVQSEGRMPEAGGDERTEKERRRGSV